MWHSSLNQENSQDLERVQKSALKVICGEKYLGYKKSLDKLQLQTLYDRRDTLCLNFAKGCTKNPKFSDMFPKNNKNHPMELRNPEQYQVIHANTERFRNSAIIHMQHLLNEDADKYSK